MRNLLRGAYQQTPVAAQFIACVFFVCGHGAINCETTGIILILYAWRNKLRIYGMCYSSPRDKKICTPAHSFVV